MKQRPILFNTAMVKAILSGEKTQTRRLIKPVKHFEHYDIVKAGMPHAFYPYQVWVHGQETDRVGVLRSCPMGQTGDTLFVREKWWHYKSAELEMAAYDGGSSRTLLGPGLTHDEPIKEIDGKIWEPKDYDIWRCRPSIHMPRWASRITLEIADVRAERLQDISEEDADAEGADTPAVARIIGVGWSKRDCFAKLWNSIEDPKGATGWAANPWVWVVSFRKVAA